MTIEEIQAKLDAIAAAMCGKGLITPRASYEIYSGGAVKVWTDHGDQFSGSGMRRHNTIEDAFAWVASLPSPEEAHRAEFLRLASAAADYAEKHMPDDDMAAEVRASIVAGMRRLSDNAITKQDA